jgi:tyrosine-protein kinase Etk/Wzc
MRWAARTMNNESVLAEVRSNAVDSSETEYRTINLLKYWLVLTRHKWIIIAFALVGLVLGAVAAYTIHPGYDAIVRFLPPEPKASTPLSLFATNSKGDHYLGLVSSRTVADDVVEHQHLKEYFHARNVSEARRSLEAISKIIVDKNQFVTVTVRAKEPQTAANIANEYVNALYRLDHSLSVAESDHRRDFFERPLEQEKAKLADAEEALKLAQQKTGMVLPEAQVRLGVGAISELKQEITTREAQLAALRTGGTEQNPQVIQLKSQIASLQGQVARMQEQNGGTDTSVSKAQMPQLTMEVEREAREVKFHEALFEILTRQYENARLEEAYTPSIELVDAAVVPDEKSWPPRKVFMLLGLFLGGLLGVIYVVLKSADLPRQWKLAIEQHESMAQAGASRS